MKLFLEQKLCLAMLKKWNKSEQIQFVESLLDHEQMEKLQDHLRAKCQGLQRME
jgi:hypothetical protein